MTVYMDEPDKTTEEAHQCQFCTDFGYLSLIKCHRHNYGYCITHPFMCGCGAPHIQLKYRFSNEELAHLLGKIEGACVANEKINELKVVV